MKKMLLLILMFFALTVNVRRLGAQSGEVLDQVVAVVDNEIILLSELKQQTLSIAMQYGINPATDAEKLNTLMKEVLDNLILQKVLYVKAIEDSVVIEDRQVEELLDQRINMMIQQYGSREKVKEYFGSSVEKIKKDFAEQARQSLMAEQVRRKKEAMLKITRREVEHFYTSMKDSLPNISESYHIGNLLVQIKPGEEARARARTRLENILARIQEGADFKKMAKDFSDDKASAKSDGELGFFQRGELVKEFEEVAYTLQPGEMSGIVETAFGFHIIQLIERQGEKINCRHILAVIEPTREDEQRTIEKIKAIHQQIKSGEVTFEAMVQQHSDDAPSKENNGDLGWFEKENLQPREFELALRDLTVGEVSPPIKTKMGLHILKLFEKQEARPLDIKTDWERIENWALQLKKQQELKKWVDKLKERVYINIKEVSFE
ncbi:peptidylprolyl isomerase [candidate division KSB1 bacterium]|nr:peptidylprolyl isomerase [candidate division KSB1 bacterium]